MCAGSQPIVRQYPAIRSSLHGMQIFIIDGPFSTIARTDPMAVFALLKGEPKQFLLRYQELAQQDAALPKFSEEFVRAVRAL